ncbi:MAG: hypothetical protein ABIK28_22610, partial [Planctomycetota bacterium]
MKKSFVPDSYAGLIGSVALAVFAALLIGCGSGSSGGGGSETGASGYGTGISLVSITFTEYTDLSG